MSSDAAVLTIGESNASDGDNGGTVVLSPASACKPTSLIPVPMEVLRCDFRQKDEAVAAETLTKVVTWNLKGVDYHAAVKELKALEADIICLQEVEYMSPNSGRERWYVNIAKALCMNAVFCCEFQELDGFDGAVMGVTGSCILSNYDLSNIKVIKYKTQPLNWQTAGRNYGIHRHGGQIALLADIQTPLGSIVCVNPHLELHCGIEGRLEQFCDVMDELVKRPIKQQVIAGDLSTVAHGLARLSPWYANDWLRLGSIGKTESEYWNEVFWDDHEMNDGFVDYHKPDDATVTMFRGWHTAKSDHIRIKGLGASSPSISAFRKLDKTPGNHEWLSINLEPKQETAVSVDVGTGSVFSI